MSSPATPDLSVLIVDDDENWVRTLVAQFQHRSIRAEGISQPKQLLTTSRRLDDFDMVFMDMRLGTAGGHPITAADLLLHVMTYAPSARVVVFTQDDISVQECARCIQLGALGIIPKTSDLDHFVLVATVYRHVGNQDKAREERIRSLWAAVLDDDNSVKGRHLEMLAANLFDSVKGFRSMVSNKNLVAGEVDLIVENEADQQFWKELTSFHIVVECRHRNMPAEKSDFSVLEAKIRSKNMCTAGIFVSWLGVSEGFKTLQGSVKTLLDPRIFSLDRDDLQELVRRAAADREPYLRRILANQF